MGEGKVKDKKIFVLGRDKIGWSIDKDREGIIKFLETGGFKTTKNIFRCSHIFCVWADLLLLLKYRWFYVFKKTRQIKVIAIITNDITSFPEKVEKLKPLIDVFVAPSKKVYNFLKSKKLTVYYIPFFVDPEIFKPLNLSKDKICRELRINLDIFKGKIIIGSFQRDSLGDNLSQPKWQKNPDLLLDLLQGIEKNRYIFLMAGPRRHYIIKKCREKGLPYFYYGDESFVDNNKDDIYQNNLPLGVINLLYNLTDLYLVTSKSEGGPKQVIESALTKTMIFSTPVGLVPDFLHPKVIFKEENLTTALEKINNFINNPESFTDIIEYNYQSSLSKMNFSLLRDQYKEIILKC